jgi:hypothetical protein
MQKAGSAWFFNITNDLLIEAGHQDIRVLRGRFHLQRFMTKVNCNIDPLTWFKLKAISIPHWFGNTYAVKTHDPPIPSAIRMMRSGSIKATYIYRDPRDAALSAFEHGERIRKKGTRSKTGFDKLHSIEEALHFVNGLLPTWEAWVQTEQALIVRYESMRVDPIAEAKRLVDHLNLTLPENVVQDVIDRYSVKKLKSNLAPVKLHFHKGQTERWKEIMNPTQIAMSRQLFGDLLTRMEYEV